MGPGIVVANMLLHIMQDRRRVSTKSRRRRTQLNLVDEATAEEATDHLHYTLPRIALSAILHPLFPIVGQALRAPLLAPRLGETEGSVDPAGVPPRLLGQDTEEVPLRQALGIVQLLLRRRRLLLRVQGGDLLPERCGGGGGVGVLSGWGRGAVGVGSVGERGGSSAETRASGRWGWWGGRWGP